LPIEPENEKPALVMGKSVREAKELYMEELTDFE